MALYALIGGRVVQALGAGAMVPVSMALVGDLYPPGRRATPLGIIGAVDTAGWVLGHLYGGVMVQFVEWPVLFWINIPITTVVAFLTWRALRGAAGASGEGGLSRPALITTIAGVGIINVLALLVFAGLFAPDALAATVESALALRPLAVAAALLMLAAVVFSALRRRGAENAGRPDWIGAALITIILAGLNLALGGAGEIDTSRQLTDAVPLTSGDLVLLGIAAAALVAFVLYERRAAHPLFDLDLMREKNVPAASVANLLVGFCLMVGLVSVPLFVNAVIAETPDQGALVSGLLLGTFTIPMALASIPGGMLSERFGYRLPTVLGLIIAAVGFFLGRGWTPDITQTEMGLHLALAGIGLGLTIAPIGTAVINAAAEEARGNRGGVGTGCAVGGHDGRHKLDDRLRATTHDFVN